MAYKGPWAIPSYCKATPRSMPPPACQNGPPVSHSSSQDYLHNPKMRKAVDINRYDEMGLTPLHHAARLGHADIVRAGASERKEFRSSGGRTWHRGASLKALIEGKADPLLRDRSQGLTALDFAQRGRDWDAGPNEEAIKAQPHGNAKLLSSVSGSPHVCEAIQLFEP